jgi:hypothetical protein
LTRQTQGWPNDAEVTLEVAKQAGRAEGARAWWVEQELRAVPADFGKAVIACSFELVSEAVKQRLHWMACSVPVAMAGLADAPW